MEVQTAQAGLRPPNGLIRFVSNNQIEAQKAEEAAQYNPKPPETTLSALVRHTRDAWDDAKRAKIEIEEQLLKNLRAIKGEYDPKKLAAIRTMGGSEVFMMITAQKCRDAKAWILDILQPSGDKPWSLDPTPVPDLPPDVKARITQGVMNMVLQGALTYATQTGQAVAPAEFNAIAQEYHDQIVQQTLEAINDKATECADKMSHKIEDQMIEGNFQQAFRDFVEDVVKYPAGILKAPILRKKKTLDWVQDEVTGKYVPKVQTDLVLEFERVSPWDIYPSSDSTSINKGDLIERHRLSRKDLNKLLGVPGYKDDAIRTVLNEYGSGGLREWLWTDVERAALEQRNPFYMTSSKLMDALQYWGSVQGKVLLDYGMSPQDIPDPDLDYDIEAWLIGNHVIKAVINPDKLGDKPYYKTSYEPQAGSFWGKGVPDQIEDIQEMCNGTARALMNNMGIASGPQVEVNIDKLAPGTNAEAVWPWKIWQSRHDNTQVNTSPAVKFYQPAMLAESLLNVYDRFKKEADEFSGIPAYAHGDPEVGGAGNTASGLSMLMSGSSRGVKSVVWNIDIDSIAPVIRALYNFNMLYDSDEDIKGDVKINARGSSSLMAKEQLALRRKEFMAETLNPTDLQIMGLDGRKELLKETVKAMDLPVDKIIPDGPVQPVPMGPVPAGQGKALPGDSQTLDPAGAPAGGVDVNTATPKPIRALPIKGPQ